MKKPLNNFIMIVIGTVVVVMAIYVTIMSQLTGKPLDSASSGQTGQVQQQLQSPAAEQAGQTPEAQPSGADQDRTAPANQAVAGNQTSTQVQAVKPAEGVELKTWTGIYVGRIDNNFIEIKVGDEPRTFLAPVELIGGALNKDDPVIFDFYKNNSGQLVLVSFKKMVPAADNP